MHASKSKEFQGTDSKLQECQVFQRSMSLEIENEDLAWGGVGCNKSRLRRGGDFRAEKCKIKIHKL